MKIHSTARRPSAKKILSAARGGGGGRRGGGGGRSVLRGGGGGDRGRESGTFHLRSSTLLFNSVRGTRERVRARARVRLCSGMYISPAEQPHLCNPRSFDNKLSAASEWRWGCTGV